jgi:hypothetical protein
MARLLDAAGAWPRKVSYVQESRLHVLPSHRRGGHASSRASIFLRKIANGHVVPSTKPLSLLFEASELKAASEQVNASDRSHCLKVLSASVVAARHPGAGSAL